MNVRQQWGRQIKLQRTAQGMSQVKLAALVGVDQSAVSFWEKGLRAPSLDHQIAIGRALRVHPQVLFAIILDGAA